ncbi:hypothetical protein AB0I34_43935 [Kribbella sp. NPDC050281]|uniref:hypothetical protein n=1 Tax=Kribbella sp. NPDC050281 TaxID=3155515 RepID=UPI0033C7BED4
MKLPTRLWDSRPPRWFRITSVGLAVLFAVGLRNAHGLIDVFWGVLACSLLLVNAVAPKGLYDGRFNAWTQKHPIVSGGLVFLVLGGSALAVLSDYVDSWLAAVIVLPLSAAFVAWITYRERATTRET